MVLVAPFSGTVTAVNVDVGEEGSPAVGEDGSRLVEAFFLVGVEGGADPDRKPGLAENLDPLLDAVEKLECEGVAHRPDAGRHLDNPLLGAAGIAGQFLDVLFDLQVVEVVGVNGRYEPFPQ